MRWRLGEKRVVGRTSLSNDHGFCWLRGLKKSPAGLVRGLEMPGCWDNKSKPVISASFFNTHDPGFLNSPSLAVD